jgi:hypothetical protein
MSDLDQRIRSLASYYLGWKYSLQGAKSAVMSPGIPPNVYDPTARRTNCSVMSASLLIAAYPGADWTFENWKQLMVYGGYPRDSPVQACVAAGVGERVTECPPGQWCLVQGWASSVGGYGHCFLAYQEPDGGDLMILQAATGEGATYGPARRTLAESWPGGYYIARLLEA